ncbi:MAG: hypothetical protein LBQ65_10705, partial [Tannerellaceae bacterium]|nr:hypothetical protein [Tannerellaceae bacterium]
HPKRDTDHQSITNTLSRHFFNPPLQNRDNPICARSGVLNLHEIFRFTSACDKNQDHRLLLPPICKVLEAQNAIFVAINPVID